MPWSIMTATSSTPHQAVQGQLVLFNLAAAAADSVINEPTSPSIGTYFGASIVGQALGYKLELKSGATVLYTLNVDNESVWLVYTGSTWKSVARFVDGPNFEARFTPLGAWLSAGADANLADISGNSRDLTKGVTIPPGMGYGIERLATGYPGRYSRADATFQLAGAMSYEFLSTFMLSVTAGYAFGFGSGSGGQVNNIQWGLRIDSDAGVPRWRHRQQSGVNVNAEFYGPVAAYGPAHVVVTRAAPSAGTTLTKMYVNGILEASANLTTPDGGGSGALYWGGTAGNQAPIISQWGEVWNVELTASQVAYLARLRLSKLGPLGP